MKRIVTSAAVAALLVGALTTFARAEDKESASGDEAVMCPKCEAVWVKEPRTQGKITVYVAKKKMLCDDCKSAAANFFTTGKWQHTCKTCGDLVVCEQSQKDVSEPAPAGTTTNEPSHRRD